MKKPSNSYDPLGLGEELDGPLGLGEELYDVLFYPLGLGEELGDALGLGEELDDVLFDPLGLGEELDPPIVTPITAGSVPITALFFFVVLIANGPVSPAVSGFVTCSNTRLIVPGVVSVPDPVLSTVTI